MSASSRIATITSLLAATGARDRAGRQLALDPAMALAAAMVARCRNGQNTIMVVGNGGSAAIASHLQNDLGKAVGGRAVSFQATPILTAYANDEGYEKVYLRQVERWADPGDLLIAISSSGRSRNILGAAEAACERGCELITFTGFASDNPLSALGEINFHIASHDYGLVEASHAVLAHVLSDQAYELVHPEGAP